MEFASYILKFAEKQSEIAIPGLGTLHFKKEAAQISDFHTIQPPRYHVHFTNDFQGDINGFAQFLSQYERIPLAHAEMAIQNKVNQIGQILAQGLAYELKGIGSFSILPTGMLEFKQSESSVYDNETFGLGPLKTPEVKILSPSSETVQSPSSTPEKNPEKKAAPQKVKKKKRKKFLILISLLSILVFLIFSVFVYLCQFEPQTISISVCSEFNSLIPIGEFVFQLIQPNGTTVAP